MKIILLFIFLISFSPPIINGISQVDPISSTELEYKVNLGDSREYVFTKINGLISESFIDENGNRVNIEFDSGLHFKIHVYAINETDNHKTIWIKTEFDSIKTKEGLSSIYIIPTTDKIGYWERFVSLNNSYRVKNDYLIYKEPEEPEGPDGVTSYPGESETKINISSLEESFNIIHRIDDGWIQYFHRTSTFMMNGTISEEIEFEIVSNSNDFLGNIINLSIEVIAFLTIISVSLLMGISLAFILKKLKMKRE